MDEIEMKEDGVAPGFIKPVRMYEICCYKCCKKERSLFEDGETPSSNAARRNWKKPGDVWICSVCYAKMRENNYARRSCNETSKT